MISDHDPNDRKYGNCSDKELRERLANLELEEEELIEEIRKNYNHAKEVMNDLIKNYA